jgi:hypothetical protein
MRKLGALFFVLACLAVAPQSQAAQMCIHLTNFCESIVFDTAGAKVYGNYDWLCEGDWTTSSIIGNSTHGPELGTVPAMPDHVLFPYAFQFSFKLGKVKLFDLNQTKGLAWGIVNDQSNQPFTISDGPCRAEDVDRNKPSVMSWNSRAHQLLSPPSPQGTSCLHVTNFCDTIVLAPSGTLAYGNWDFECTGDYAHSPVIGKTTVGQELAGRPNMEFGDPYPFPYSAQFSFKPGKLFDLYLTDGVSGRIFVGKRDQPYTITQGSCTADDIEPGKPRMLSR